MSILKCSLSLFICFESLHFFSRFFLVIGLVCSTKQIILSFFLNYARVWFGCFQLMIKQFFAKPHNLNNKYWFSTRLLAFTHLSVTQAIMEYFCLICFSSEQKPFQMFIIIITDWKYLNYIFHQLFCICLFENTVFFTYLPKCNRLFLNSLEQFTELCALQNKGSIFHSEKNSKR